MNPLPAASAQCPKCMSVLPESILNQSILLHCPSCQSQIQAFIFPAFHRELPPQSAGELLLEESEASCFFHEKKRAEVTCDICGRFLCALCDMQLGEKHLCPACLDSGRKKGTMTMVEARRPTLDTGALLVALLPLFIFPFTIMTAPVAVFLALWSFRKPSSIIPRTRIRAWLALIIGGLQCIFWIGIMVLALRDTMGGISR